MTARRRTLLGLLGALVLLGLYVAVSGALAARDLTRADQAVRQLRAQVTAGEPARAEASLQRAQGSTAAARRWLSGPVWAGAQHLPAAGPSVRLLRSLTAVAQQSSQRELAALVRQAAALDPDRLRRPDGSIDLALLRAAAVPLETALQDVRRREQQVRALPTAGAAGRLITARTAVADQLRRSIGPLDTAVRVAKIGPGMLGADGPRSYLMIVQNLAELRGTGGNVGAFAVLSAKDGDLTVVRTGKNTELAAASAFPDFGPDYRRLYGRPADLLHANVSPHFPYTGRLWADYFQRDMGQRVDGVVAIDSVLLSNLMRVSGPVTLADGQVVSADNVVDFTLRKVYADFAGTDPTQAARKDFLQEIARAVIDDLSGGDPAAGALASALGRSAGEHHLQLWSARADEQQVLAPTPLAATLGTGQAAVVLDDLGGSKLDYYLHTEVNYAVSCAPRRTTVTVTLTNRAPAKGLPPYVVIRSDVPPSSFPVGQSRSRLSLYLPGDPVVTTATLDGRPVALKRDRELGHAVLTTRLALDPGQTRTLVLAATGTAPLAVLRQSRLNDRTTVARSGC